VSRLRKQVKGGAARKSSPSRQRRKFRVGDRVRILDIPEDLKDPNYDLKHDNRDSWPMKTGELFRFCLGRVFRIYGFGRYGHAELEVSKSPAVRRKFGLNTIWIELEFLKLVRATPKRRR
jgi:hypothetical protein